MGMIWYYLLDRHDKIYWNVLVFSGFLYSPESDYTFDTLCKTGHFPVIVLLYGIIILLLLGLFIASFIFEGNFFKTFWLLIVNKFPYKLTLVMFGVKRKCKETYIKFRDIRKGMNI